MVSVLTHSPRVLWAYLTAGEAGLSRVADRLHSEAHDRPGGKFGKREALYLPQSPFPPLLWRNECERCRFWQAGGPGEAGRCHVVGREGDRWGGERIHPRGWCAFYLPPAGEPAFRWFRERLNPTGATSVRGEYCEPLAERGVASDSEERGVASDSEERGVASDSEERGVASDSEERGVASDSEERGREIPVTEEGHGEDDD